MKIATWNVNSMNVRLPHVLEWLQSHEPDVLVLQEIKQLTENFPSDRLAELGYHSIANGQKTYNGVAVISKTAPSDPVTELPGFEDPQRRVLAATIDGLRVVDLYVPNGSEVGSEKYAYKLEWLDSVRNFLDEEMRAHENLVVLGDFNIAPADEDVYDPEKWGDAILCSPLEREALGRLLDLGLSDIFRKFDQPERTFSWWDYRAAGFRRNAGLRIDLILTSASMTASCTASYVDKEPRAWERPSDHAPVVADAERHVKWKTKKKRRGLCLRIAVTTTTSRIPCR
jgi:exodeoxyribonuclease-3